VVPAARIDAVVGLDAAALLELAAGFAARPAAESPVEALRVVQRARAQQMAAEEEEELWPLRMTVVDAHPVLVQQLIAASGQSERALAEAIAEGTGTRVGVDVYPTLLASVQACAMRVSLQRWLAGDFTASLPDLIDEAWAVLAAGLPPRDVLTPRCSSCTAGAWRCSAAPAHRRPG
jgi:hypothetical protein